MAPPLPRFLVIWALFGVAGCGTVPAEAPQLSAAIGADLVAFQTAHKASVRALFDTKRQIAQQYVDEIWMPRFVENWVDDGRLIDIADGTVVWDEAAGDFRPPDPDTAERALLSSIVAWGDGAVFQIARKRRTLIEPIDQAEADVLREIDAAYAQAIAANRQMTGLLVSLRDVQRAQDAAMADLGLGDVRERLDDRIAAASRRVDDLLNEVKAADLGGKGRIR